MINLKDCTKQERFQLVRGCEPFFITYKSPKWQNNIVNTLINEFGKKYEIPIRVILTAASKAKRHRLNGSELPLDKNKYTTANTLTKKTINLVLMKEFILKLEDSGYLTLMLGYYLDKNNYSTSCLRFHDKLLNNLDQKHCDKWGMPRCEGVPLIEVVDSLNSTKTKKVFHSLKKFKGVRFITDQVEVVNKEYVKHTICYEGQPCVVVYKRRFEDNLLGGGRWYNIGTFQVESSSGRNTITIDGECTIEIDLHCLHPSLLASSVGFKLPDNFDPYDISHMVTKGVDKKILRNFMKPCFMSLIYGTSRNTALHEIRTHLWNNKKIASWLDEYTILNCLEEHNHCLHKFFYKKEQWKYCQYIDSCIATDIMLHFALKGEVCLNYHDSWRVAARLQLELIEVMKESWRKHVGDLGNFKYDYKD